MDEFSRVNPESSKKKLKRSHEDEKTRLHQSPKEQKVIRRKQLQTEQRAQVAAISLENLTLTKKVMELEAKILELKARLEDQEFEKQITKNSQVMVRSLSRNSPLTNTLFLGQLINSKQMKRYYGLSKSNYHLIMAENGITLTE